MWLTRLSATCLLPSFTSALISAHFSSPFWAHSFLAHASVNLTSLNAWHCCLGAFGYFLFLNAVPPHSHMANSSYFLQVFAQIQPSQWKLPCYLETHNPFFPTHFWSSLPCSACPFCHSSCHHLLYCTFGSFICVSCLSTPIRMEAL